MMVWCRFFGALLFLALAVSIWVAALIIIAHFAVKFW